MPDQVPQEIREERNHRLLDLVNEIAARKYDGFIGRQVEILVEGPSKKNAARIVLFDGSARHQSQLMDVKIERTGSFTLYGDPAVVNL
jgi:tRNA-2-methylthio-N6-dimethylallyladenosine synthase